MTHRRVPIYSRHGLSRLVCKRSWSSYRAKSQSSWNHKKKASINNQRRYTSFKNLFHLKANDKNYTLYGKFYFINQLTVT